MEEMREYTGEEIAIVLWIPKKAKRMNIEIQCEDEDGNTSEMIAEIDEDGIAEARKDYLTIDPDDDAFVLYKLTPEFKAFWEAGSEAGKDNDEIFAEWDIYKDLILKEMY